MTIPRYVKCPCQHCGVSIEFDADLLAEDNKLQSCPRCGLETILFVPAPSPAGLRINLPRSVLPPPALPHVGDTPAFPPQRFALDMTKVDAITKEADEVAGILSADMQDEPDIPPPATKTPALADPLPKTAPLIPLSPLQILGYLEARQSIRCTKSIPGFTAGQSYPVKRIPVTVLRTIKRPAMSGPDHDYRLTGRDIAFAVPDDWGKDRLFIDSRHLAEGVTITRSAGDSPPDDPSWAMLLLRLQRLLRRDRRQDAALRPPFALETLVEHFDIPSPPDIAQANPEQLHANLRFLDAIEKLATNGFLLEASLRDDLARLAIPDCASHEDATGTAITPMVIAWALLKLGLHPQANATLLPAEPVLIVAPSGLLVYRMLDDYKALFAAAMPPVIRLDSQETFCRLASRNRGRLAPGWYISSYQEIALKFQLLPTIPDGPLMDFASSYGMAFDDADARYKEHYRRQLALHIKAYTDFFEVSAATPDEGLEICRRISKESAIGIGEERNGIRCVYRPALADLVRDQFAAVIIDAGTRIPSEGSIIGRGLKTLAPRYRLVLTGPSVKQRLAEPPLLPAMIPAAIPPSGPILQESPARADGERFSESSPCPVCGSSECCCESSAPIRLTTSLPSSEKFALDMGRVDAITKESEEVAGILSVVMRDEAEKVTTPPKTAAVPVPELPKSPSGSNSAPLPSQFSGLDAALQPVLEHLLTRDSWSSVDFNALAREFHFMPLKVRDALNEWADDFHGDFILDGDDPIIVRRELIAKEKVEYG